MDSQTTPEFATLIDLLRYRARRGSATANKASFTYLNDGETVSGEVSFEQLDFQARSIAANLQEKIGRGDRVLLVYPPSLQYIVAFLACAYAGAIAVPAVPPVNLRTRSRLLSIAEDAEPTLALGPAATVRRMRELAEERDDRLSRLDWLAAGDLPDAADAWRDPDVGPEDIVFLQYTSGSTGTPKGVMVSHRNLMANVALSKAVYGIEAADVFVSWLPPHHDFGLIGGIVFPIYVGCHCVQLPPSVFLMRPYRWLKLLSDYRARMTGAPNFAYELCVQKVSEEQKATLDLGSLGVAVNGAERIRCETLRRFADAFSVCGFRPEAFTPAYGLAESTLLVSAGTERQVQHLPRSLSVTKDSLARNAIELAPASAELADLLELVTVGKPARGEHHVLIVDPSASAVLPDGRVGEIWVNGASVARGYWKRPESAAEVFAAPVAGRSEAYLRTGDLGFMREGELYITGRMKEMMIFGGRNIYPQDVEAGIEKLDAAFRHNGCAVFSLEDGPATQLIVVQEVESRKEAEVDGLIGRLRAELAEAHEIADLAALLLVKTGHIPRTSSGKIQRVRCRELYVSNAFSPIWSWTSAMETIEHEDTAPRNAIEERLAAIWCDLLGAESLSVHADFLALGAHSLLATQSLIKIREEFALNLSLRDLFEHSSIAALAQRIGGLTATGEPEQTASTGLLDASGDIVLSFGQRRLWFLDQLDPGNTAYNIPCAVRLRGALDAQALSRSLDAVVARHDVLRSSFVSRDGSPLCRIAPHLSLHVALDDCSGLPDAEGRARAIMDAEAAAPFDLAAGPLIRARLIRLAEREHLLVLVLHHIVSDGWSMGILVQEFGALYAAFSANEASPLPHLSMQYAEFARRQHLWLEGEAQEKQLSYWRGKLAGSPDLLAMPTDRPRPAMLSRRGAVTRFAIPGVLADDVRKLSASERATPFMVLAVAFKVLLARHSGQSDICIGTPIANRMDGQTQTLIGMFFNILVLRTEVESAITFAALLAKVRDTALDAYANQDVPFDRLVDAINPARHLGHAPLFQVMLILQDTPMKLVLPGLELAQEAVHGRDAKFDLTLTLTPRDSGYECFFEYSTDLFDEMTVAQLGQRYVRLLEAAVSAPQTRVEALPLLDGEEKRHLLEQWNATDAPLPPATLADLIERQTARVPAKAAVIAQERTLSYAELDAQANRLAHWLGARGIGAESLVGVCLERGADMLVALLGIAKAGAAYIPLDPSYPRERLAYMVKDGKPALLITSKKLRDVVGTAETVDILEFESAQAELAQQRSSRPARQLDGANLAYVLYTSGSTGKPKGVGVSQRNLVNFLLSMRKQPGLSEDDVLLSVTALSFDIAGLELYLPLTTGATVVVSGQEAAGDPAQLARLIEENGVSIMQATPSTWRMLVETGWSEAAGAAKGPLILLCGGEALPAELAERLLQHVPAIWNLYGPTETTIWSTLAKIEAGDAIHIGHPIANTRIHILDGNYEPVPLGVAGELYIGGAGLARGYLNQPALTAERFVPDPHGRRGERLYATGDLARYRDDGAIEYLGRLDHQVKIRGFRIELGEIEAALEKHEAVRQAVVLARDQRLAAYVVPNEAASASKLGFSLFYFGAHDHRAQDKYALYLNAARFADEHGFEAVWTPERHFHEIGSLYPNPAILNAALATSTERIGLRAGSVVLPLHSPVRVAEEWAVVDNLSHGRAGLAIASGWHPRDFVLAPRNYAERKRVMAEHIATLQSLWRGEAVKLPDGTGKEVEIHTFPRPVQAELPLWITAAGNPETFALAGALGANVLTHLLGQTIGQLAGQIAIYRDALRRHGHDPEKGRVTLMVHTYVGEDFDTVLAQAKGPFLAYLRGHLGLLESLVKSLDVPLTDATPENLEQIVWFAFERYSRTASLIGTPESCLPVVRRLEAAGVDEIACLIDWMDGAQAMEALPALDKLRMRAQAAAPTAAALRTHLKTLLPDYMVPQAFVQLDRLPLTPNGKIDRKALPEAEFAGSSDQSYLAPRTATEVTLAAIWSEVLGAAAADPIGAMDNFFVRGGHSLMATQVVSRVRSAFQVELPLRVMFETPTVEAVARQIDTLRPTQSDIAAIVPMAQGGVSPLSAGQLRLWFLDRFESDSAFYNDPVAVRLFGDLDVAALERAFQALLQRHDVLRSTIVDVDGEPHQAVAEAHGFSLHTTDLSSLAQSLCEAEAQRLAREEAGTPFDLIRGPWMRVHLIRLAADEHLVLVTLHHIVSDGWSLRILLRDIAALYASFHVGRPSPLPALPIRYADYAVWQRQRLQDGTFDAQLDYWRTQLAGIPTLSTLPTDRPRPAVQSYRGAVHAFRVQPAVTAGIDTLNQRSNTTLFMMLAASLSLLLARHAGQNDICIGTPIAGRRHAETEGLIGFFVNTVVLRTAIETAMPFDTLLQRVRTTALQAYVNQDLPFEKLIEAINPLRNTSHAPLFQVMLVLQDALIEPVAMPGLTLSSSVTDNGTAKFDLTLEVWRNADGLSCSFKYSTDLFDERTVARLGRRFCTLLEGAVAAPHTPVGALTLLEPHERRELLYGWNSTATQYDRSATIHGLFEAHAAIQPDAVALIYEGQNLSYGELNSRANRVAHNLIGQGIGPESMVGFCMERSLEMIVGLLGILKAGGAYVSLAPDLPEERRRHILTDARPDLIVTQARLPWTELKQYCFDEQSASSAAEAEHNPRVAIDADNLAHAIFTSGSTGKPKGTLISHRNVVRLMSSTYIQIDRNTRFLHIAPLAFDASTLEIWSALLNGAQLVIASHGLLGLEDISRLFVQQRIDVVWLTATLFNQMVEDQLSALRHVRHVLTGGEAVSPGHFRQYLQARGDGMTPQLTNGYGPTECTVFACRHDIDAHAEQDGPLRAIPIGKPFANCQVYVLDGNLEPVPQGIAGELYIGGAGLARGYLKRPELTAERFVPNPFGQAGERLYRTGDLARYLEDGSLDYLGRIDTQVKLRGFRIELGEIEAALAEQDGINGAFVLVKGEGTDKRLVAYVTGTQTDQADIKARLKQSLPEYMIPAQIVVMESFPLTPNGKLDQRALPEPEGVTGQGYVAPRNEIEASLCALWAQVLKLEQVGVTDNFFELGGHSLLAVKLIEKQRQAGYRSDIRTLFEAPTVAGIAAAVALATAAADIVVPENRIPPGCNAITPDMLPLVELDQSQIERIAASIPGGMSNIEDIYPLAPLQEGILFHHLMNRAGDTYLLPTIVSFDSRTRMEDFVDALQQVIDRHAILRTAFAWDGLNEPVQVVWRQAKLVLEIVEPDASDAPEQDTAAWLRELRNPRQQRLDVRQAPLLQLHGAPDAAHGRWLLHLMAHHLVNEHTTLDYIIEEIRLILDGQARQLPQPVPFRNFVAQARLGISREEHAAHFRSTLGHIDEPTAPYGILDVQGDGSGIIEHSSTIPADLARRTRQAARRHGVSAAAVLHQAWAQVLAKLTGKAEVVFGTVLFGRLQGQANADRALGLFINTLPLALRTTGQGVGHNIKDAQARLNALMRHEHAPLSLAQQMSGVAAPTPLFTTLLNYRYSFDDSATANAQAQAWEGMQVLDSQERTNYPITVSIDDLGEGLRLTVQTADSIGPATISAYLERALTQLVTGLEVALEEDSKHRIDDIDILAAAQREQLLHGWNDTARQYDQSATLHGLFEAQSALRPGAVALVYRGQSLSYGELNARANRVAHHLIGQGVGPDSLVGLCLERSLELVVGLLGILKAGGAYLPLDPAYPRARLAYTLQDAAPALVVTESSLQDLLPPALSQLLLDADAVQLAAYPDTNPQTNLQTTPHGVLDGANLAYAIYTSGSTGRPKGIGICHGNAAAFLDWVHTVFDREQLKCVLFSTSVCFDLSIFEMFAPLSIGGTCWIVDNILDLLQGKERHPVTLINTVPSAIAELHRSDAIPTTAGVINLAGEALSNALVQELYRRPEVHAVYNLYGPTEDTTYSTWTLTERGSAASCSIGKPIANSQAYILDSKLEPVPVGVAGELYLGGHGLARGYLNRPDLTAERFVPNPHGQAGTRLYATGDLARYREDGSIDYLGRLDHQIKVRGFRIELGEIEAALEQQSGIRQALVIAKGSGAEQRLVAYVTGEIGEPDDAGNTSAALKAQLKHSLPDYMIPAQIVHLDSFPLTPNGKLDRKALPEPENVMAQDYVAPRNETEARLCALWAEVLKLERVGVADNFFELGGHSLTGLQVITKVNQVFSISISMEVIFQSPTIAVMAALIEEMHALRDLKFSKRELPEEFTRIRI